VLTILVFLIALFLPPIDTARLSHPNFQTREQATRELRADMGYWTALRLEVRMPVEPEGRHRAGRLLTEYWFGWVGPFEELPYVDSLNSVRPCESPNSPVVARYLTLAGRLPDAGVRFRAYRRGTQIMIFELWESRVPPAAVRFLVDGMAYQTREYDRRHGLKPERLAERSGGR
jgi:hypothetical protein